MADFIRLCPNCKLQYVPDSRIYIEPDEYCPRCGTKLIPDNEDEENEQSD